MKRFLSEYGMIPVLLALCLFFSGATIRRESATGPEAAQRMAETVAAGCAKNDAIVVAGAARKDSEAFARLTAELLAATGYANVRVAIGSPRDLVIAVGDLEAAGTVPKVVIASGDVTKWTVLADLPEGVEILTPKERIYSGFLKPGNLVAIVDRIVVIAVIAIGMTLVILTGGIDLSVGSLLALSAVLGTLMMRFLGGPEAAGWVVWLGFLAGTLACAFVGAFTGVLVAWFRVAPFITTLAMMMMARGLAYIVTGGFSIYQVPEGLTWLGQGRTLGIPNTVIILTLLYVAAHLFMNHTRYGRYIYAVGGNEESARLSGVPVKWVLVFVYLVSGLAAGFGGCIQASQINSGAPSLGEMFELDVIAAVVVGGTSLSGGSGKVLGTLIGAFIISVIRNGMNQIGYGSYTQTVVLGAVILLAVLIDKVRQRGGLLRLLKS